MMKKKYRLFLSILTLLMLLTACIAKDNDPDDPDEPNDPDDEITEPTAPKKLSDPAVLFSGDEKITNTSGNLNNQARSIEIDGWVYFNVPSYTQESIEIPYGGFYKMKTNGGELTRIDDEMGQNFFSVNGLIYDFDGEIYDPKTKTTTGISHDSYYNSLYFMLVLDDVILALAHDDQLNQWFYLWMNLDGSKYYRMALPRFNDYQRLDYKDGWLYYVNASGLNRIHPDDSDQSLVTSDASEDFLIIDDSLYYVNVNDGHALYTSELNGSNPKKLVDQPVKALNSDESRLFFISESDGLVYRVNLDGSQLTLLSSVKASTLLVCGEWLCFQEEFNVSKNYHISLIDWSQKELFVLEKPIPETSANETKFDAGLSGNSQLVITDDGWVYYDVEGLGLYKQKTDGTSTTKLADFNVGTMMIIGDYLYYTNTDYLWYLFRMKKDGTEIRLISAQSQWGFGARDQWIYTKSLKIKTDGSVTMDLAITSHPRLINDRLYYQKEVYESGNYGLTSMALDGTDLKTLLDPQLQTYAWIDQDKIYYALYDETTEKSTLMRLDPDTKISVSMRELDAFYWSIKEIHQGRLIWLSKDEKTLKLGSVDGLDENVLMTLPTGDYYDWVEVSSDRLYVNVMHTDSSIATLYSFALDGSDQKEMNP